MLRTGLLLCVGGSRFGGCSGLGSNLTRVSQILTLPRVRCLSVSAVTSLLGGVVEPSFRLVPWSRGLNVQLPHDALVRQLLVRFGTLFWGQSVSLVLMRNLQARLQVAELTFLAVHGHRIFARMPAALLSYVQLQNYP